MKIPPGYTEQQILEIIENVVNSLARNFRFGYHDIDDLKQEGRLFAVTAMNEDGYDPTRPLANFLYRHVRNRMINFRRNNYTRYEPPCIKCPFYDPKNIKSKAKNKCSEFMDRMECERFSGWEKHNIVRKNLMEPKSIQDESGEYYNFTTTGDFVEEIEFKEILSLIDEKLPVDLRSDYLKMRQRGLGNKVSKNRQHKVRQAIMEIIKDYGPAEEI